ncbi:Calcium and integrin-binding member 3 [Sorochytrium milnesiophthora]
MGANYSIFSQEEFEWYEENTFFTRKEIVRLFRYFQRLTNGEDSLTAEDFAEKVPELCLNPFRARIAHVFSDEQGVLHFEDFLDCMSVFSEDATRDVKSFYAFQIYDYDGDDYLGEEDIFKMLREIVDDSLSQEEIRTLVEKVMDECDIDGDHRLSFIEFEHVVARCPDFIKFRAHISTFRIRL